MPRLVDHEERRRTIIETTWQLIADHGIDNASMRDIARACGYAGPGILNHYFSSKDALLLAAYRLICDNTNARIAASRTGKRGLTALHALSWEIIPADPVTTVEARVAVAFWQRAQTEERLRQVGKSALEHWRSAILACLAEAQLDQECAPLPDANATAEELLNVMIGLHITSMLDPEGLSSSRQRQLIKRQIERLAVEVTAIRS